MRRSVVLVKTDGVIGPAPVGDRYSVRVPAELSDRDAQTRAFRMLKRERPSENTMCWTVEEPTVEERVDLTREQLGRILAANRVIVTDEHALRWKVDDSGLLEVQLDDTGGIVLLPSQWQPVIEGEQ